jgi:type IV secretion system protein VirD4
MELTRKLHELYMRILARGVGFLPNRAQTQRPPEASWASPEETLAEPWLWKRGRLLLGTYNGHLIGSDDNRHLVTIAGSRAGKTRTVLLPNLYTYPGSMLVLDPKGEAAALTAVHRHDVLGQDVRVLDPFRISGVREELQATLNPLAEIDPDSEHAIDDAALIGDALIVDSGNSEIGGYFSMAARNMLRGMILFTLLGKPREDNNLIITRKLLDLTEDAPDGEDAGSLSRVPAFKLMAQVGESFDGLVAMTGTSMLAKPPRERESVIATAVENLAFLDSPALRRNLARSTFRLDDLAKRPTTIYLCLPAGRMATHFRWLRLIIDLAIVQLERYALAHPVQEGSGDRIVFVLEEFATLNHMKRLEVAAGLMAGMGVGMRLWVILQDLGQLKALYRDRWQTFMGNAGVIQCFGLNDLESLNYMSERLGDTSYWTHSYSAPSLDQRLAGHAPETTSLQTSRLCTPAELATLVERDSFRQVVVMAGHAPRLLHRVQHATVQKIRDGQIGFEP